MKTRIRLQTYHALWSATSFSSLPLLLPFALSLSKGVGALARD